MGKSQFDYISESELNEMFGGSDAILEYLNFLYIQFADAMERARFYFDTLVEFIESQEQKELKYLKDVAEKLPDNRKGNFWQYNYPIHWKDIFEENLKEAFIVSLFSVLEVYLVRTCEKLHDNKSQKWEVCKGKSKLCKCRKCLMQYVSTVSSLDWDAIYKLWRIRCVFVHNQRECIRKKDKKILDQFADKTDGLSIRDEWIQIDSAFCKNTLRIIREFGSDLGRIIRDDLTNSRSD